MRRVRSGKYHAITTCRFQISTGNAALPISHSATTPATGFSTVQIHDPCNGTYNGPQGTLMAFVRLLLFAAAFAAGAQARGRSVR